MPPEIVTVEHAQASFDQVKMLILEGNIAAAAKIWDHVIDDAEEYAANEERAFPFSDLD